LLQHGAQLLVLARNRAGLRLESLQRLQLARQRCHALLHVRGLRLPLLAVPLLSLAVVLLTLRRDLSRHAAAALGILRS
jgi:hypothetical protein